jgi:hypothetical protein
VIVDAMRTSRLRSEVLARLECFLAHVVEEFEFLEDLRDFFEPPEAGLC